MPPPKTGLGKRFMREEMGRFWKNIQDVTSDETPGTAGSVDVFRVDHDDQMEQEDQTFENPEETTDEVPPQPLDATDTGEATEDNVNNSNNILPSTSVNTPDVLSFRGSTQGSQRPLTNMTSPPMTTQRSVIGV